MTTFCAPARVEFGAGALDGLGDLVKALGKGKALIVMDAFLASPTVALDKRVGGILSAAGISSAVYSGVASEPTSTNVQDGTEMAHKFSCDCVIAIGGGSAIDTAKAVAVKAVNPELALADIPKCPSLSRLPLIAVPTTSGTGSEGTRIAVITNLKTGVKENPGHPAMIPDIAILDPDLTVTLPKTLTAFTGMDALTHAMEAYVSNKATDLTDLYAYKAMEIIGGSLPKVMENGADKALRSNMALASYYAGIAFSNASTNLAHAGGRALGAQFHVPHGLSVALLLPFVMEFGLEVAEERYARVAVALGAEPQALRQTLARQAVAIVDGYNDKFGIWTEAKRFITDLAAFRKAIPEMTAKALAGNGILTNPKVPTESDINAVFEKLAAKLAD
jgi:alcohol dehydrogenase class IV